MASKRVHMHVDIKGALMNWRPREWRGCVRGDDGRVLSPQEVKAWFLDELAKGRVVLPFGGPCEGFDYAGGGCPGHEIPEPTPCPKPSK